MALPNKSLSTSSSSSLGIVVFLPLLPPLAPGLLRVLEPMFNRSSRSEGRAEEEEVEEDAAAGFACTSFFVSFPVADDDRSRPNKASSGGSKEGGVVAELECFSSLALVMLPTSSTKDFGGDGGDASPSLDGGYPSRYNNPSC